MKRSTLTVWRSVGEQTRLEAEVRPDGMRALAEVSGVREREEAGLRPRHLSCRVVEQ